ncbi:uncharacterized protein LOC103570153 [Microplitis demolitor]|uniref:uncharacterized protein LOC103570153 n=1 Tax=Microplitis demolitor TaxID=69319 RepID=UPI00044000C7|nr:uncharacterized protein LOC103570153 [Microplitis demolitor]
MSSNIEGVEVKKIRVCVIGAGAAGLCAVRHLSNDKQTFEPAVFEQTEVVGGTWVYVDKTQIDYGHPIHSSMYKNLRTNFPLQLMNFPDFSQMNQTQPSCGTHEQVLKYLQDYAHHFNLYQYIQFSTKVISVEPIINDGNWRETIWKIKIQNLKTDLVEEKTFDAVLVCNGHYSEPKIPLIPGIETFSGDVMHSHDYRNPEKYYGKTVIILGAGPSGIDIGIEITGHAAHVYLSHSGPRLSGSLPENMTQTVRVEFIRGNEFHLTDGTIIIANALLYCTGYKLSFPFLDEACQIKVNNDHVEALFKHLINVKHPKMAIVGIPFRIIPFPLFHIQIQYFLRLLKGQVTLPPMEIMMEDSKPKTNKHFHALGDLQWEYNDYLANAAGIDKLPAFYKNGYREWTVKRTENLLKYKDSRIEIVNNEKVNIFI